MKKLLFSLTLLIGIATTSMVAIAQIPATMNLQGYLADADGKPEYHFKSYYKDLHRHKCSRCIFRRFNECIHRKWIF